MFSKDSSHQSILVCVSIKMLSIFKRYFLCLKGVDNIHVCYFLLWMFKNELKIIKYFIYICIFNSALPSTPQSINPILIRVYPLKWGWPYLPDYNSNLFNSHSPSHSIHGILLLQTNIQDFSPSPLASSTVFLNLEAAIGSSIVFRGLL